MDEVTRISEELEKTIRKNDTARAFELLKSLDSIPMTLDTLSKTHIGHLVNKIRKGVDNPEVSSLCKSMVKRWKKVLLTSSTNASSTRASNNNSNTNSNNNTAGTNQASVTKNESTPTQNSTSSATTSSVSNQQNSPPISSSSSNNERIKKPAPIQTEVPPTTSEVRLKCRQLLTEALKKPLPRDLITEPFLEEEILAGRIEECIYQEFKGTDMKYKTRVRSRVLNLKDDKNPYLRLNLLRGDLAPERIAVMTADEMASDELKKEREKFTREAINDHQMALTSGTKTSEIKCPACKKYNVTYNQVQTRSADEPMTTFCFCNECGKRWKFC